MRLLHGSSQPLLANLLPYSMWQVLSPSPPPGQFYLNSRYAYCELAPGEGARRSPARPCIPLVSVRWEPGTDGRADWRGEKLMVVLTGHIFLWHFIAVEIWSTWFAQITNISKSAHKMEILCGVLPRGGDPEARRSHCSWVQPRWHYRRASLLRPPIFPATTTHLVYTGSFHRHCALLFSSALQRGNDSY